MLYDIILRFYIVSYMCYMLSYMDFNITNYQVYLVITPTGRIVAPQDFVQGIGEKMIVRVQVSREVI